jgi:hypothetical protein
MCLLNPADCSQKAILSRRQKKMCVEKINALCTALKIEAALAARSLDYYRALEKRREAVKIHETIIRVGSEFDPDNQKKRLENQRYYEYWYFVTEGYVSLIEGKFGISKEWFKKAHDAGVYLNQKRCFPNYFRDTAEIKAHEIYISAIEKVRSANWSDARGLFHDWLSLNRERADKYDMRFDNIQILEMACAILQRLSQEEIERDEWEKLFQLAEENYVVRPTFALLEKLRELSHNVKGVSPSLRKGVVDEIAESSEHEIWVSACQTYQENHKLVQYRLQK